MRLLRRKSTPIATPKVADVRPKPTPITESVPPRKPVAAPVVPKKKTIEDRVAYLVYQLAFAGWDFSHVAARKRIGSTIVEKSGSPFALPNDLVEMETRPGGELVGLRQKLTSEVSELLRSSQHRSRL